MKKSIRISKKVYSFAILLTFFTVSICIVYGKVIENEFTSNINQYNELTELQQFTFDIDQFKENIEASPDECWRKPAENRKNTTYNKLTELQQLIIEENFEEAYDKLLHDIKPKLTGLKQNEHGELWGNGVYKKPWVTCDDLKIAFEEECNLILSQINPVSVPDDDDTSPPTIYIHYLGTGAQNNPGFWIVIAEDLESGIDEVRVQIDENEFVIHDFNGEIVLDFYVNVPIAVGTHDITVIAVNNDNDYFGDQESSTLTDSVYIEPYIPPPPPIIIG